MTSSMTLEDPIDDLRDLTDDLDDLIDDLRDLTDDLHDPIDDLQAPMIGIGSPVDASTRWRWVYWPLDPSKIHALRHQRQIHRRKI